jgi:hypothetical protein
VPLAGGDLGRQRQAAAVTDQVDLRPEAAARAAQRVVRRLARRQIFFFAAPAAAREARAWVPSMQNSSGSISPSSLRRSWRRWMMRSSRPALRIQLKRW